MAFAFKRIVAVCVLACGTGIAHAEIPLGPEFRVSSLFEAGNPHSTVFPDGRFVFAWTAFPDLPGNSQDVYTRRYRSSGRPYAPERTNTWTALAQHAEAIASDDLGRYVVVWTSEGQDGSGLGVFGQRYDASGSPSGAEFQVNQSTGGNQAGPTVAMSASGSFVVVWADSVVHARLFDATGAPVGAETPLWGAALGDVAMDGAGNFVIAYPLYGVPVPGAFARLYDASASPIGSEFRVSSIYGGAPGSISVARRRDGPFVVVWDRNFIQPQFADVLGQRFDAAGVPVGANFGVNLTIAANQLNPDVAIDADGDFVVVWEDRQFGPPARIAARRFDWNGLGGNETIVNFPSQSTYNPSVSCDPAGNFVVSWSGEQTPLQTEVFARRYAAGLSAAALAVDPAAGGGSDGNGVLEAGETVTVRPSWLNANTAAQTFTGAITAFTGPGAPGNPSYTIDDDAASYGTVPSGATANCTDCYAVALGVPTPRPAVHWDAELREVIAPAHLGGQHVWSVHVGETFGDVPRSSPFYRFVERLVHNDVTGGCAATSYCPGDPVTREQMAVFVLVAKEGGFVPPACGTPMFADVPASSPFCPWIEELARRGVVGGCGPGTYCPAGAAARDAMSVFVLRTLDPALNPPACTTPMFNDVPASHPFCRWIEELVRRGVVSGCGGGNYCPASAVTREQMSVFLTVTFGLTLYGP